MKVIVDERTPKDSILAINLNAFAKRNAVVFDASSVTITLTDAIDKIKVAVGLKYRIIDRDIVESVV